MKVVGSWSAELAYLWILISQGSVQLAKGVG